MKIIEGIEALLGNNFTGEIQIIFEIDSPIKNYIVSVLDGKLIFCSEDLKKHFITIMVNQSIHMILLNRIK